MVTRNPASGAAYAAGNTNCLVSRAGAHARFITNGTPQTNSLRSNTAAMNERLRSNKGKCFSDYLGPAGWSCNRSRIKWTVATAALATVAATKQEPGGEYHSRAFKIVIFVLNQGSSRERSRDWLSRSFVSIQRRLRNCSGEAGRAEAVLIGSRDWSDVW
jgi:hypothetical protein